MLGTVGFDDDAVETYARLLDSLDGYAIRERKDDLLWRLDGYDPDDVTILHVTPLDALGDVSGPMVKMAMQNIVVL